MRLINNTSIEFSNALLADINNLEYIDVQGKYNCCNEFNQRLTVKDGSNARVCSASYCNYKGQAQPCGDKYPDNCPNPQGSYYFRLTNLFFYINGVNTNILNRTYNITQPDEVVALIANVAAKLPDEVIIDITATYDVYNYLCLNFEFTDLPSGIIPNYFILRNDDTCYIKSEFECLEIIPNSECTKFVTVLKLNNSYNIQTITVNDEEIIISKDLNLILVGAALISELTTKFSEINILLSSHNIVLTYEIIDTDLFIRYNAVPNKIINIIYVYNITEDNYYNYIFRCEEQTINPVKPIYSTKLYIEGLEDYDTIYAFNVIVPIYNGPVNILETPILVKDILTLPEKLKTVDNLIDITIVPILHGYEITVNNSTNIPYDIILHSNYNDYKVFAFGAATILNFSRNYNSNIIEYLHNNLYIKSNFFGFNEFADGVYSLNINLVTKTEIHNYKFCIFVFQNICDIANKYNSDKNVGQKIILLKELVEEAVNCGCDCETACMLYKEMTDLLYGSKCLV